MGMQEAELCSGSVACTCGIILGGGQSIHAGALAAGGEAACISLRMGHAGCAGGFQAQAAENLAMIGCQAIRGIHGDAFRKAGFPAVGGKDGDVTQGRGDDPDGLDANSKIFVQFAHHFLARLLGGEDFDGSLRQVADFDFIVAEIDGAGADRLRNIPKGHHSLNRASQHKESPFSRSFTQTSLVSSPSSSLDKTSKFANE
jgi:hypothetical protein